MKRNYDYNKMKCIYKNVLHLEDQGVTLKDGKKTTSTGRTIFFMVACRSLPCTLADELLIKVSFKYIMSFLYIGGHNA